MTKYAMRSMYVAPKDHLLVEWDLSQAETNVSFVATTLASWGFSTASLAIIAKS